MTHIDPIGAATQLSATLAKLHFGPPVTHVYDPLSYALDNYAEYVERYGRPTKRALFLGMNPGPWGMAQTGVPFGDATFVREWLGIDHAVGRPAHEHPKRPVQGLQCPRSEVSGSRLWGAVRDHYGTPERFFARSFVGNYCPLSFMEDSGRNLTPDKLPRALRETLYAACDEHLRQLVCYLQPRWVIGIGAFAEARARAALAAHPTAITIGRVLHPSPANPRANANWLEQVRAELAALGICEAR